MTGIFNEALAQQIVLIVLILLYGTVLTRLVPQKYHIYLNIFIALVAIFLGLAFGLDFTKMGVSLTQILPGIFVAIAASIIITVSTLLISAIPPLRRFFIGENLASASGKLIAFETAIRIPLGTALIEEVLFRGVLLGLMLNYHGTLFALILSSLVFGLWHIFPTINQLEQNDAAAALFGKKRAHQAGSIAVIVVVTFLAGLLFGWLRIISNSILAPWIVHWSINASGVLGITIAKKLEKQKDGKTN